MTSPTVVSPARRYGLLALGLIGLQVGLAQAAAPSTDQTIESQAREATRIADEYVAEFERNFPDQAELSGLTVKTRDSLSDNSLHGLKTWQDLEDRWSKQLAKISSDGLVGRPEWITFGFVKEAVESSRQLRVCRYELWPVNQLSGWQSGLLQLLGSQPVGTEQARAEALKRWGQMPRYLDNEIANMREGLRNGYSTPKRNVQLVIDQLDGLLKLPIEEWPFYTSIAERDSSDAFREQWKTLLTTRIKPAVERYNNYLRTEYLQRAREAFPVTANRDGAACYDASFRFYTTLDRPAKQTFDLGRSVVDRNLAEALELGRQAFGSKNLTELTQRIQLDPANRFSSREEQLAFVRQRVAYAQTSLAGTFSQVPKSSISVEPFPAMLEQTASDSYFPAAQDGSRPATYRITLYRSAEATRSNQEITAFHEAYPGHHLQIGLAQEQPDAHPITRLVLNSGFAEGWARYAEGLAEEMNMYSSAYAKTNRRLWPARGMVVDPGLHIFGWTREQAIKFIAESGRFTNASAESVVDRIAVWPAQLTACDTGALEFFSLRKQAQETLGSSFDLREFHRVVLSSGSVTLPMLRQQVERWLAEKKPQ